MWYSRGKIARMNKTLLAVALLTCAMLSFGLVGCKSDPHDTHISTGIAAPR
jgi:hypothetical protein